MQNLATSEKLDLGNDAPIEKWIIDEIALKEGESKDTETEDIKDTEDETEFMTVDEWTIFEKMQHNQVKNDEKQQQRRDNKHRKENSGLKLPSITC